MRRVVGRIGRAHGLAGEMTVEVRTDEPDARFAPGALLFTDPPERGPVTVDDTHWHSGRMLLRLRGVEDRTAAEGLRGTLLEVDVDPAERPADPEEYFDHQLVGLRVVTTTGDDVGQVAEVVHLPAQDLLAVHRPDAADVFIPFVAVFVPEVDLGAGRIVIDPPPGLLADLPDG